MKNTRSHEFNIMKERKKEMWKGSQKERGC